eukprot:TRINITY_DN16963_c0_g1_i1.p1 TRINITY_DN16963_c0_g1~~TRINITY_DN16963_c0_g1_i1.p1  ORF type:complete len:252 (+),score=43.50 TRINITY_DN16963_c0_g1_i1:63-818(+)
MMRSGVRRAAFAQRRLCSAPVYDSMPRYPNATASGLLRLSDYVGTTTFAWSGAVTAGLAGMDLLGCTIVGVTTAVGGGTFRDAVVLHKQPFWVEEVEYLWLAVGAAVAAFFLWPALGGGGLLKSSEGGDGPLLWCGDTLGIGAFAVIGAMNGMRMGVHPSISAACGMFTATFGGLTRDVLCSQPTGATGRGRILHSRAEIYATTALAGASVYVVARKFPVSPAVCIAAGAATAVLLRAEACRSGLVLPTWT